MAASFIPLASGSRGNASLLDAGGGVLIDAGLGARDLAGRLTAAGRSWRHVGAVLLTHTHGDHWTEAALAHVARLGLPLFCHDSHAEWLAARSPAFDAIVSGGRVRTYAAGVPFAVGGGVVARAHAVSHDSHATFAFRFDGGPGLFGPCWSLGYAADLGVWDDDLLAAFAGLDALALEFNHEEQLQRTSRRPLALIRRVMGDEGHLSNRQAAEFIEALLGDGGDLRLRSLVALHLSQECNRVPLAAAAARDALARVGVAAEVVIASQGAASVAVPLGFAAHRRGPRRSPRRIAPSPGLYDECA